MNKLIKQYRDIDYYTSIQEIPRTLRKWLLGKHQKNEKNFIISSCFYSKIAKHLCASDDKTPIAKYVNDMP